jgi:vanillate O-demethylase ferredoxin subunit
MFPKMPFYRYPKVWAFAQELIESQNVPRRNIIEWNWQPGIKPLATEQNIKVNISQITDIAQGVKSYHLTAVEGKTLPSFTAGAHIDIFIKPNIIRQYSLCNSPSEINRYVIAVKCDEHGRGGSQALHKLFSEGQQIKISTPRNHFELNESANKYHLVAGGIGLTPMLSMAHQLHQQNKTFTLHLFARSVDFLPFANTLKALPFYHNISVYFDNEMPLFERDIASLIGKASDDKELYLCGPQPFMNFFIEKAQQAKWLDSKIKFEAFSAVTVENNNNKAFELTLLKSNKIIQVQANESIVEAIERSNINITVSCGQGTCGTCVCKVSKGEVDHRDAILTTEQKTDENKIALCVSRAKGDHLSIIF